MLDKPLTVGELKELLRPLDDDLPIYTEGCDCIDFAGEIDLYEDGISIQRYRQRVTTNQIKPPPTLEQLESEAGIVKQLGFAENYGREKLPDG